MARPQEKQKEVENRFQTLELTIDHISPIFHRQNIVDTLTPPSHDPFLRFI